MPSLLSRKPADPSSSHPSSPPTQSSSLFGRRGSKDPQPESAESGGQGKRRLSNLLGRTHDTPSPSQSEMEEGRRGSISARRSSISQSQDGIPTSVSSSNFRENNPFLSTPPPPSNGISPKGGKMISLLDDEDDPPTSGVSKPITWQPLQPEKYTPTSTQPTQPRNRPSLAPGRISLPPASQPLPPNLISRPSGLGLGFPIVPSTPLPRPIANLPTLTPSASTSTRGGYGFGAALAGIGGAAAAPGRGSVGMGMTRTAPVQGRGGGMAGMVEGLVGSPGGTTVRTPGGGVMVASASETRWARSNMPVMLREPSFRPPAPVESDSGGDIGDSSDSSSGSEDDDEDEEAIGSSSGSGTEVDEDSPSASTTRGRGEGILGGVGKKPLVVAASRRRERGGVRGSMGSSVGDIEEEHEEAEAPIIPGRKSSISQLNSRRHQPLPSLGVLPPVPLAAPPKSAPPQIPSVWGLPTPKTPIGAASFWAPEAETSGSSDGSGPRAPMGWMSFGGATPTAGTPVGGKGGFEFSPIKKRGEGVPPPVVDVPVVDVPVVQPKAKTPELPSAKETPEVIPPPTPQVQPVPESTAIPVQQTEDSPLASATETPRARTPPSSASPTHSADGAKTPTQESGPFLGMSSVVAAVSSALGVGKASESSEEVLGRREMEETVVPAVKETPAVVVVAPLAEASGSAPNTSAPGLAPSLAELDLGPPIGDFGIVESPIATEDAAPAELVATHRETSVLSPINESAPTMTTVPTTVHSVPPSVTRTDSSGTEADAETSDDSDDSPALEQTSTAHTSTASIDQDATAAVLALPEDPTAKAQPTTITSPRAARPGLYSQASRSMVDLPSRSSTPDPPEAPAGTITPARTSLEKEARAPAFVRSPTQDWARPPPTPAINSALQGGFFGGNGVKPSPLSPLRSIKPIEAKNGPSLGRRRSMGDGEIKEQVPEYTPPMFGEVHVPKRREEEGKEGLPQYWCHVHIEGYLPRKMEFQAPGIQAKDRGWKKYYFVLHGTSLCLYKHDIHKLPVKTSDGPTVAEVNQADALSLHVHIPGERRVSVSTTINPVQTRRASVAEPAPRRLSVADSSPSPSGGSRRGSADMSIQPASPARRVSQSSSSATSGTGDDAKDAQLFPQGPPRSRASSVTVPAPSQGDKTHARELAAAHLPFAGGNALVKQYTLQNAESGLAADYVKKKNVVRVRAEGEQFLLQTTNAKEVVDWIEAFQAATNVSLELDIRPMPKIITLPRRRRPRRPAGEAPAGEAGRAAAAVAGIDDTPEGNARAVAAAEAAARRTAGNVDDMERMLAEDQAA